MLKLFRKNLSLNFLFGPTFKSFYGISSKRSRFFCKKLGTPYRTRFKQTPKSFKFYFSRSFSKFFRPSPIRERLYAQSISFKIRNGSYQGFCINNNLPSRGQRSKNNGKTAARSFLKDLILKYL